MRLSAREKTIVAVGGGLLAVALFWIGVWEPVQEQLKVRRRKVESKQADYREVRELGARFATLKTRIETIEKDLARSKDFSILSHLENLANRQRVRDRIVQMKPKAGEATKHYQENSVEIKMEKVRLSELVQYLYQVENSPELLRVRQLQIRPRFDDPDLLDVRFQVSAYEIRGAG